MSEVELDRGSGPLHELLDRIRGGDPVAWEQLVRRYERLVWAVPHGLGLPEPDCEEVFQATWLALHRQIGSIRWPDSLPAWILTTAQRQTWRLLGARRPLPGPLEGVEVADPGAGPVECAVGLEERQLVQEALERLAPRCRDLLALLYGRPGADVADDGGRYAAAARALGVPLGSIGPTRQRCLAALARVLEEMGWP